MTMTTQNLLVELFVEELPPKVLEKLGREFGTLLALHLTDQNLFTDRYQVDVNIKHYASPRRLGVWLKDVAAKAIDLQISRKLMPVSVGLDASGNATPALLKKLQALGADASAVPGLKRLLDGKAEALFYDSVVKGATLAEGLQKALLETIAKLPIPKVMTYQLADGWTDVKFVRPVHGLVALHGSEVVAIEALGLKAGNITHGHRFEALVDPILLKDADSYAETMERDGAVIASFDERKQRIRQQLTDRAPAHHFPLLDAGVSIDDALLEEVTALVERPNVLVCEFEKEFLSVPQECLILTMKANQKYFPLLDAAGKLTNKFLVVSNISPSDASAVIQGNERVVRPRLADAKFFFDQDSKKRLASRLPALDKVVYHNKLGTLGERMERVSSIAYEIGMKLAVVEGDSALAVQAQMAAQFAKADLVTDMVGEFPELQGIMGRYYALNDGLGIEIADAIEDHYKPRFAGDQLPRNKVGIAVALADKLETLVGMFGIGNLPSGDKDPFALRRHALGVVRMLMELDLPLNLDDLVDLVSRSFDKLKAKMSEEEVQWFGYNKQKLSEFIFDRLAGILRDDDFSVQQIDAVLALHPRRLGDVPKRLAAVRAFAALPEAPALAAANKRVGNILKKAEGTVDAAVKPELLQEAAEKSLADALKTVGPKAEAAFASGDYAASLQALAALKAPVDAFFDGVMVNAEDPALKANRLGLLATLHQAMNRVADLSKLAA